MNLALLDSLQRLKSALNNDRRVLELNALEEKINNSDEVMILAYKKDEALRKYNDANKYSSNQNEISIAQKELYEAKYNLDTNEYVISYNLAYKEVRKMYDEINSVIFKPFFDKDNKKC